MSIEFRPGFQKKQAMGLNNYGLEKLAFVGEFAN
jgi:hypothetical protein